MKIHNIFKKFAYLSFSCILTSFSALSTDHLGPEDTSKGRSTRSIIDVHAINPRLNLQEMQDMVKTTIQNDEYFKPLQPFFTKCDQFTSVEDLSTLEELANLSEDQRAIVSIYAHINHSLNKECSLCTHIIKLGNLCSLFLSYKSLNTDTVTSYVSHGYGIIKEAGRKAQKYLKSPTDLKLYYDRKRMMKRIQETLNSQTAFVLSSEPDVAPENYLHPLVLLEGSTFNKEDFFYALSKGIVLFGLQRKPFPGHGRVFESPYLAWRHDLGHFLTLCKGASGQTATYLTRHVSTLNYIAKTILEKALSCETNGKIETKGLIIDAAFNVIHESNLPACNSRMSPQDYFDYILTSAIKSDLGFSEFSRTVNEEFAYRFLSDLPKDLVKREPALQDSIQITPEKKRYLSVTDYNWKETLRIIQEKFIWLQGELFSEKK
jgi:hypothetical protein